jgi:predicted Zn-dependent protease
MARAGYDPREAIAFWKRMMETKNGQQPPELMSTHPADATRINQLENLMARRAGGVSDSDGRR